MKVFIQNRDFRQLTINQWISTVGDTIFILLFLNYVADASFAPPWRFYSLRFQRLFLKFCKSLWEFWLTFNTIVF